MSGLLVLFANNILPIFLAAGTGFILGKRFGIQPRPVSQLAFYIFSPCLIFDLLTSNQLNTGEMVKMGGFAALSILGLGALTWILGQLLRLERRLLMAVLITTMFSNAGNYGLSLNLFAFGEHALAYASLYFVVSSILIYSVGVIVASLGSAGLKQALLSLFKVPVLYAVILALVFNLLGWQLLVPLDRTVKVLGSAAIPVLLVLLGLQLQNSEWNHHPLALILAHGMRLLAGPALAVGLSLVFGLQGAARQAGIAESAMPTAVVTTVLATEYELEPAFVTSVVITTTLLSPLTLTPLLAYLGA